MRVVAGRKEEGIPRKEEGRVGCRERERGCWHPLDRWGNNASGMTRG